jgi:hypothetical protein
MKSALFVDFDNIYSGLRKLDQASADRFARHPTKWMNWVVNSLALPEHVAEDARRRVLVRRCYLNPQVYQKFRPFFNLAGFEIVDCPALTAGGKTSTDIHMVLDMVDLLQHEARYDEFIVFSADADFTPVLRKVRRWDRRTTVLAIGFPSAAYRASADLVIDQDAFVRDALGIREKDKPASPKQAPAGAPAIVPAALAIVRTAVMKSAAPSRHREPEELKSAALPVPDVLAGVRDLIRREASKAGEPVPCARIATAIAGSFAAVAAGWNGKGTFRKFLESIDLTPLVVHWNPDGGCIHDPARHGAVVKIPDSQQVDDWSGEGPTLAIVKQIHEVTSVPLLSPDRYRLLFEEVAEEVSVNNFDFIESGKRIRDRCRDAGRPVSRADVSFVLRGLLSRGHKFDEKNNTPQDLSRTFANQVRSLCVHEQIILDVVTEAAIRRWIE